MNKLLEKIRNFFNTPCAVQEIEDRFYKRLEDMKNQPAKQNHSKSESKIPPVSLF